MKKIVLVWHDVDRSRTVHEFDGPADAEPWLRSVLAECCPAEDVEAAGYPASGLGMLHYYEDQGLDDVGSIAAYIDGVGVEAHALQE